MKITFHCGQKSYSTEEKNAAVVVREHLADCVHCREVIEWRAKFASKIRFQTTDRGNDEYQTGLKT